MYAYYFSRSTIFDFSKLQSFASLSHLRKESIWFGLVLMLNIRVNNFSVMFGRSHSYLGITSTFFFFFFFLGGGLIYLAQ